MWTIIGVLLATALLTGPLLRTAAACGPIRHMTILEEAIRHPDFDPATRTTLEGNLKHAKGGAVGPDLGDFDSWWSSADASSYDCTRDLARRMPGVARSRTGIPVD